jgi:cell division protein FtsL
VVLSRRLSLLLLALTTALVLGSALSLVYARHEGRRLFIEHQQLTAERDDLNIDWGRLQIEHSTLALPARVEKVVRDRLHMTEPDPAEVVIVQP